MPPRPDAPSLVVKRVGQQVRSNYRNHRYSYFWGSKKRFQFGLRADVFSAKAGRTDADGLRP